MAVNNEFNDDFTENDLYEQRRIEENEKRINELREQIDELQKKNTHSVIKRWNREQDINEFLDAYIDVVEDLIFQCYTPRALSEAFGVPQYKMFLWTKSTKYIKRIELAFEFQSEYRMGMSEDILNKYLKDPRLTVQAAGLVRELALHHSRMAGFRDPRKFGKTPDTAPKTPTVNIVSPDGMALIIEELRKNRLAAGGQNGIGQETVDGQAEEV